MIKLVINWSWEVTYQNIPAHLVLWLQWTRYSSDTNECKTQPISSLRKMAQASDVMGQGRKSFL